MNDMRSQIVQHCGNATLQYYIFSKILELTDLWIFHDLKIRPQVGCPQIAGCTELYYSLNNLFNFLKGPKCITESRPTKAEFIVKATIN